MRMFILMILFPLYFIANNRDSLNNNHYKIRFSFTGNVTNSNFDFQTYSGTQPSGKGSSTFYNSNLDIHLNSKLTVNPQVKIDFELPYFFKLVCGFQKNTFKFNSDFIDRNYYSSWPQLAPGSVPWSYTVTGHINTIYQTEHIKEEIHIESIGTFFGIGFCKSYKKLSFDLDYFLSLNQTIRCYNDRKVFDDNYNYLRDENVNFVDWNNKIFHTDIIHNISTSIIYRITKKIALKGGYQFSRNMKIQEFNGNSSQYNYFSIDKVKHNSFFFGLVINLK